ncbi:hypothetical protein [Acinetobacter radioresistens]|uniref:hypothetical protein n=1 Tax=Acinetobacter radioresistens TaxID=40216 RepID=UPI000C341512|nr:hypothetical protein [Acinetobacter radioresistens]PKD80255.1 hypothetical protein CW313_13780 [Acinetobacter radioresistens]
MKNGLLRILVVNANDPEVIAQNQVLPITLSVNGQLVSGELISRTEFYALEQNVILKHYVDFINEAEIKENGAPRETPMDELQLLHLKNAAYWVNGAKIPSGAGTNIVVNIDSVDAFNIGSLKVG